MRGYVAALQARVNIALRLSGQPDTDIEFIVDTGFEGALTLPLAIAESLKLPYFTEINANLADDTNVKTKVYVATIVWNGKELEVAVLAMGQRPLLGTALLQGKHLGVDFVDEGTVAIEAI